MIRVLNEGSGERWSEFKADFKLFDCRTRERVDEIENYNNAESVEISGLTQQTFEYFVETYGKRFKKIYFFKNPKISDLSALGGLEDIEFIKYYWNNTAAALWDMSGNRRLVRLELCQFTRLKTLEGVQNAPRLKYLSLTAYSDYYPDVEPLEKSTVEVLDICAKFYERGAYSFYKMPNLKGLYFIPNLFSTEIIAWLAANLNVRSESLNPYVCFYDKSRENRGDAPDVLICGKRKPSLYSDRDGAKIEKYVKKFDALKEKYRYMSFEEAFGRGDI